MHSLFHSTLNDIQFLIACILVNFSIASHGLHQEILASELIVHVTYLYGSIFHHKMVNIFLSIDLNMCFWCSKEPAHCEGSFENHIVFLSI